MQNKSLIMIGTSPVVETAKGTMGEVLEGDPQTTVQKYFAHPSGKMSSGYWDCQQGTFALPPHPNNEFCIILEGGAEITDAHGETQTVKAGDAFILPQGLATTWKVETYVKKIFVVVFGLE